MVDGFYTRLNTTAEAAGIGYLSIIEPAAVLAAVLAVIGTAVAMIFDILKELFLWIMRYSSILASIFTVLAVGALISVVNILFSNLAHNTFFGFLIGLLAPVVIFAMRALIFGLRNLATRKSAYRVISVVFSLIFLAALCFGAHEWGVHEAAKVAKGGTVDLRIGGLDMSAISALPVQIQAIDLNPVIKQLSANSCLLEIGSGPYSFLIYDPARQDVLTVPSNAVILINSSAACKQ